MLSRLKIGARLGVAFGSLVILLAAANGVGLHGLNAQKATADDLLNVDVAVLQNAAEVRRLTLEERSLEKDIFINVTNHEAVLAFKKSWDEANNQLLSKLEEGAKLAPGDELRQLYEESSKQLIAYNNGFAAVYTRIEAGEISHPAIADMVFGQYKDEVHQLDQLAADINQSAVAHIDGMDQDFAREYHIALIGQLVFSGLTLLIAAFLAVRITRSITRPLQQALEATRLVADGDLTQVVSGNPHDETGQLLDAMGETNRKLSGLVVSLHRSSDQVFDGAHHVLLGSQELAARTDEQVAALQQTASSMEQITALVQQNSASTEQANQLAGVAARAAQSGGQEVEQSVRLMQEIAASSQRINDIVKVIDGIAFQTNILALNASVEAARAGEHGRGFSVVAAEVRTLASRSAESAKEIRTLIEETRSKIDLGARQAEHSGQAISDTVTSIEQLSVLMQEIAAATREQSAGIGQINAAISQLDSTTHQNATLVEQSRNAAEALEQQSGQMQQLVATFKTDAPEQRAARRSAKDDEPPRAQPAGQEHAEEWAAF